MAQLEAGFVRFTREISTQEAVHRQIAIHHTDWLRVKCQRAVFASESAAREAVLCVREDAESFEEVCRRADSTVNPIQFYLEEIDPGIAVMFLAASAGQLIGPCQWRDGISLFVVQDKRVPSVQDPEVVAKAEEWLINQAVQREINMRVGWQVSW
jgi:hypothetical protein